MWEAIKRRTNKLRNKALTMVIVYQFEFKKTNPTHAKWVGRCLKVVI
jgi:hypothetical protein